MAPVIKHAVDLQRYDSEREREGGDRSGRRPAAATGITATRLRGPQHLSLKKVNG